jgi:hypothetical protein
MPRLLVRLTEAQFELWSPSNALELTAKHCESSQLDPPSLFGQFNSYTLA